MSGFDQKQREYLGFQHWVDCSFFTILISLLYYQPVYRSLSVFYNSKIMTYHLLFPLL